jgi:protein arginine kinase
MTLEELIDQPSAWLDASGSYSDVIISSRVRLARNLRHVPFATLATSEQEERVIEDVLNAARGSKHFKDGTYFDLSAMAESDRQLLVERRLISPALAARTGRDGVLVGPEERYSIMINEEDHLRFQAIFAGFEPAAAWSLVDSIESEVCNRLDVAYDTQFGYLTACPTNVGTGLRASILIHLPGLVLVQSVEQVLRGINQVGLTVRGFYGEGTDVVGSLFQISNQVTLGISESEIIETLERVVRQIIDYEYDARQTLVRDAHAQIEDKIGRAVGILSHARVLSGQEFMNLASAVRLGIGLGMLDRPETKLLNELMVQIQPSHIQRQVGSDLNTDQRDLHRANLVRSRIVNGASKAADH